MENIAQDEIKELIKKHLAWFYTRRFYAPPPKNNILARLQVDRRKSNEPPNAANDPLVAAYNLVIEEAEKSDYESFAAYFYVYYKAYRPVPIKVLADELGIEPCSVYDRAHVAAIKYYNNTLSLMRLNAMLQREVEGCYDVD